MSDNRRKTVNIKDKTKSSDRVPKVDLKDKTSNKSDKSLPKVLSNNALGQLNTNSTSSTGNSNNSSDGNINVVLRCRPLNKKEKEIGGDICIDFQDPKTVNLRSISENNNYKFCFDRAFDYNTTQKEIYEFAAKNIVDSVVEGFNGTIFAYGQTSSGKTFTMQGVMDNPELEGIIPRIIRYIFQMAASKSEANPDLQFVVKVSIIEIYNEKIRDLVETQRQNLQVREDKAKGIFIEDLSEHQAEDEGKVLSIMKKGLDNRAINFTNMNAESSRSHSLVILNIIQNNLKDLSAKAGKLYLVDLAGSEKISKTGATGVVLDEAKSINKSLTTLGLVIKALTDSKQGHIPYRESKLTRVLQESLGGNSKTCLIITCSPSAFNEAETLSTLRFGIRAKKVKNNAKVNKEYSIQELKTEVNKLEGQLGKFKSRVEILEQFLLKNGLPLPNAEVLLENNNMTFNNENLNALKSELINKQNTDSNVNVENKCIISSEVTMMDNNITLNPNMNMPSDPNLEITTTQQKEPLPEPTVVIDDDKIIEINNKYIEVLDIVNDLELEKQSLEGELKKAVDRIQEFNIEQVRKENMLQELEEMKEMSEKRAQLMELEISRMKKYMVKNRHNLSLISEVNIDLEIVPLKEEKIIPNLEPISPSPVRKKTFFAEEIEYKPEICLEIVHNSVNTPKKEAIDFKTSSFKNDEEININMLTTNPFSIGNNLEMYPNSSDNLAHSKIHNNTPFCIGNITLSNNTHSNSNNTHNNQCVDDLLDKLKQLSDKCPELNHIIESYREKIYSANSKSDPLIISTRKLSHLSSEEEDVKNERKKTDNEKRELLKDIECKVEKLFDNYIKEKDLAKKVVKNEKFCNWNLKCWKEKYRNFNSKSSALK